VKISELTLSGLAIEVSVARAEHETAALTWVMRQADVYALMARMRGQFDLLFDSAYRGPKLCDVPVAFSDHCPRGEIHLFVQLTQTVKLDLPEAKV
jgi:hypothetical protein